MLADCIIQEKFTTTTDGDCFISGGVPPDGSHVIARMQRGLRGVEHGHEFSVGKLGRAGVTHVAGAGRVELKRRAPCLPVVLAQSRFDATVAAIPVGQ